MVMWHNQMQAFSPTYAEKQILRVTQADASADDELDPQPSFRATFTGQPQPRTYTPTDERHRQRDERPRKRDDLQRMNDR